MLNEFVGFDEDGESGEEEEEEEEAAPGAVGELLLKRLELEHGCPGRSAPALGLH